MSLSIAAGVGLVKSFLPGVFNVIDKAVEDKDQAAKLKSEIQLSILSHNSKAMETAAGVVIAEAQGHSWLQRNWRPLLMLVFAGLLVARWFGLTEEIDVALEIELMQLLKIGIGGYVVGRSGEKIADAYLKTQKSMDG
ncbi:MAG: hypothetical protein JKY67_02815 [Pseudomonadales bacterium]|nr:hypothetical protein [Pseudomonadales bacterium]